MHIERRHLQHPFGMTGRGRAQDDNLRLRPFQTFPVVGEDSLAGKVEFLDDGRHPSSIRVADADNLDIGVLMAQAQEVAHVRMIKVDARNFPGHIGVSSLVRP